MRKFSLIIPVYCKEKVIRKDIEETIAVLDAAKINFEVIVVVDGQMDKSFGEAKKVKDSRVQVIGYKTNHGKGYAVRFGFSHATGDVIGFKDAGPDLKPGALPLMLAQFDFQNAEVVIGSKRHPDSKVYYPFNRIVISWVYQKLIKVLFGLDIRDTQVGMKIYRRKVLEDVLPRMLVREFAFDIEMLAVAYHLGYRKIYEAPVEINLFFGKSTINWRNMIRVIANVLNDTLAVYYRLKFLHYYDEESKRKWVFDPELNFRINIG